MPPDFEFSDRQQGIRSPPAPWFDPSASVITGAQKKGAANQWRLEAAASEEARSYLAANYSPAECGAIARRLHNSDRQRAVTICADCYAQVGEDHVPPAPVGEMRLCVFVVDPARCAVSPSDPAIARERFEGAPLPGLASGEALSRVLGLSVE